MPRNISGLIVSWFIKVVIVLVVLLAVNLIAYVSPSPIVSDLAEFFNKNILLLILASLLFFLGALFYYFGFPINLGYPIFDGFGTVFLISFLIKLIVVIDNYVNSGIGAFLATFAWWIYVIAFIIVLLFGYLHIARREERIDRRIRRNDEEVIEETVEDEPLIRPIRTRRRVIRRRRRI
ncbi:MAG: hypothetical protein Q7S27_00055 [Nanoarchaeota archaeon]|nr:hypothetical protein [Nanoarchaeota archaeon]